MTEVNPAGYLQNAGNVNTAAILRESFNALVGGALAANSHRARGGVHPGLGFAMKVQQAGAPNMTVDVLSGHAMVPGTEDTKQATYLCFNDGTVNKSITAADPSQPRIDLVVARVQDTQYSGVTNAWSLAVVTGTPSGSPAIPTAPANSLILAQIAVAAGATSITNANITDRRAFLNATGGLFTVPSKAERDLILGLYDGMAVWRQDLDAINVYNGTAFRFFGRPGSAFVGTSQTTTSLTYTDLATVGPAVSIETADAAEITVYAFQNISSILNTSFMGYAVSGATTRGATDTEALAVNIEGNIGASATFLLNGLTPGVNVFTAKYRVNGATGGWANRHIMVRAI